MHTKDLAWQAIQEQFVSTQAQVDYLRQQGKEIYPAPSEVLNAFSYLSPDFSNVSVVIIGQDPYHGPGQAHGFSFSVKEGTKLPPSLKNIFAEIESDVGVSNTNGNLENWAKQGVVLLNRVLTVEKNRPKSHAGMGWEKFTEMVIKFINDNCSNVAFVLWGSDARSIKEHITNPSFYVVESFHPSPLSARRGFFGSKPFSKVNEFLVGVNKKPIDWST